MNLLFGSYNLRSRSVHVRYAHGAGLNQLIRFPILQMKFYFYFYQNAATINSLIILPLFGCACKKKIYIH
jgi:hypothetical protein